MTHILREVRLRWVVVSLLLAMIACSSGDSGCSAACSGVAIVPYPTNPPPGGELQPDVVRARLTQSTLDFLTNHIEPLLAQFLVIEGREARFVFSEDLLPADGAIALSSGSYVGFDLDNLREGLSLTWLGEDDLGRPGIRFEMRRTELFLDILFATNLDPALDLDAACRIQSNEGLPALTIADLRFDLRLSVDDSGPAPQLTGVTENVDIRLADATDEITLALAITACDGQSADPNYFCDDPICNVPGDPSHCADICGLVDLFSQLGGFLVQIIQPVLNDLAPTIASFISDALIQALGALPLGIEADLDLPTLLGPIFRGSQPLALKVIGSDELTVAGNDVGRGLDLGLSGGVTTLNPAACATDATVPDLAAMRGAPPELTGWIEVLDPIDGSTNIERYHFAATISQALLNQATWSAFQSGLFCFNLDAEDIEDLGGGAFSFTAGMLQTFDMRLADIAEPDAPMLAALRASEAPTIRLGAGHLVATDVEDPLLEVALNSLDLGLFMLIDDTQLRVAGLKADLVLLMGVERTPEGTLEMVVEDIQLLDIRQVYNEMVPSADLSALFELVVDIAVDAFLSDGLRIEIDLSDTVSSALGFPAEMRINTLRRDYGPTGIPHLSIYASLCDELDMADPDNHTCYVPEPDSGNTARSYFVRLANDESLYQPPDGVRFAPPRFWGMPTGRAELAIDSDPAGRHEAQARVNGGPWSGYRELIDGIYTVESPRLRSLGHHTVEVRVREVGRPASRSGAIPVTFWVDRERPRVSATRNGGTVFVAAHDSGSPDSIVVYWRHVDGAPGPWLRTEPGAENRIEVAGLVGRVEIVARDLAGNESLPILFGLDAPSDDGAGPSGLAPARGCAAATPALAGLSLLLLLLLLAPRRWSRRRSR